MNTYNNTVGIIGISHTYSSIEKALKEYNYKIIVCDINKEKIKKLEYEKYTNYKDLVNKIDIAFVATPPSSHYEIIEFFLKNNIRVIAEKPLVTSLEKLDKLNKYNNLYNILHFSFGEEINWFINNNNLELPLKIECYINDPYICNNKIMDSKLSLHGSYLDEAINPLSAIKRIFNKKLEFISNTKKYYKDDEYDYKSKSIFKISNTLIYINTNWNEKNNKDKYIDLFYKDKIIRLDSINVQVVDITNKKILFKSNNNRMDFHYKYGLRNIRPNKKIYNNLNKVILEGEVYAKNNIY